MRVPSLWYARPSSAIITQETALSPGVDGGVAVAGCCCAGGCGLLSWLCPAHELEECSDDEMDEAVPPLRRRPSPDRWWGGGRSYFT